jgi:hypothetical protein
MGCTQGVEATVKVSRVCLPAGQRIHGMRRGGGVGGKTGEAVGALLRLVMHGSRVLDEPWVPWGTLGRYQVMRPWRLVCRHEGPLLAGMRHLLACRGPGVPASRVSLHVSAGGTPSQRRVLTAARSRLPARLGRLRAGLGPGRFPQARGGGSQQPSLLEGSSSTRRRVGHDGSLHACPPCLGPEAADEGLQTRLLRQGLGP